MSKMRQEDCKHYSRLSSFEANGCGPQGVLIKSFSKLIPNLIFGGACACHDWAYFFGGCKAFDDTARYRADKEFFDDMNARIDKEYFFRRPIYRQLAKIYYQAVRKFGHPSFKWFPSVLEWKVHLMSHNFDSSFLDHALIKERAGWASLGTPGVLQEPYK